MINLNFKDSAEPCQKNILYKIHRSTIVHLKEMHGDNESYELVKRIYDLYPGQYGIFAHEYRSPVTLKQGCKSADILACKVDEGNKRIISS